MKKPRSVTVEEFQLLLRQLEEPFRTMAVVCLCFGLRISECLGLKWSDVDWLNGMLNVERGIVHQVVDDVKTPESQRLMYIDVEVLGVLKMWKQRSQFSGADDWMFASQVQIGRLPFSYAEVWRVLRKATAAAGIWSHQFPQLSPHPSLMARCRRHSGGCSATANETHGHQNHDERVRHCRHSGHASSPLQNRAPCAATG
ncbi:MAG: site-specific integrase [Candidatus Sulfotelmatobacter sp.]